MSDLHDCLLINNVYLVFMCDHSNYKCRKRSLIMLHHQGIRGKATELAKMSPPNSKWLHSSVKFATQHDYSNPYSICTKPMHKR